jgi:hypothetical protein
VLYHRSELARAGALRSTALALQPTDLRKEPAVLHAQLSGLTASARELLSKDGHDRTQVLQTIDQMVPIPRHVSFK